MKVWIKYLIATLFGIACAFILPANNSTVAAGISFITELTVRFGRYMVIPVIFFTTTVAFSRAVPGSSPANLPEMVMSIATPAIGF